MDHISVFWVWHKCISFPGSVQRRSISGITPRFCCCSAHSLSECTDCAVHSPVAP
jgi:hypothetical protein